MQITSEMVQASTKTAVELGVLPRRGYIEDLATNSEIMAAILQAALDSVPDKSSEGAMTLQHN
jgi:hypothetical protein